MRIIYEDNKKMIVYKPAGVLTQSAKSFDVDLVSQVLTYRRQKNETAYAAVINRLDRPVSGLVLIAKTKETAAALSRQLQSQSFCKQYYALVCGQLLEKKGIFVDYLLKDGKSNTSSVVSKTAPQAKRAELEYEVIDSILVGNEAVLSLVRIHLITGRHHQIRVQFASRGFGLLGDSRYGGETQAAVYEAVRTSGKNILANREIALCAYSLTVEGKEYAVEMPWRL